VGVNNNKACGQQYAYAHASHVECAWVSAIGSGRKIYDFARGGEKDTCKIVDFASETVLDSRLRSYARHMRSRYRQAKPHITK
jgi:hypothetical protein